jgi:predicted nucleic acid-binding protein
MRIFLDSSSFAKRFVEEDGSEAVEGICAGASELGLTALCVPELVSAFNRRRREGSLTLSQYGIVKRRLMEDIRDAEIIHLTPQVIAESITILETTPVRTLDALHVACALVWEAELFVSSDTRQLAAAEQTGLNIRTV